MPATLKPPPAESIPPVEQPAPVAKQPVPASVAPGEPSSRVLPGDRLALIVWLTGAAIMAYLLLKDLMVSVLLGW